MTRRAGSRRLPSNGRGGTLYLLSVALHAFQIKVQMAQAVGCGGDQEAAPIRSAPIT